MITKIFLGVLVAFLLFCADCHAYVDPGFTGSFLQFIYIIIFGVVGAWIFKPVNFLKSLFRKLFKKGAKKDQGPLRCDCKEKK